MKDGEVHKDNFARSEAFMLYTRFKSASQSHINTRVREALNTLPYHLWEKNLQISSGYCVSGKGDCKYVGHAISEKRRDSSTLGINTTYRMRCTKGGMPSEYSMLISLFVVARFWHFQSRRSSSAEFFHSNGYEHRTKRF